MCTADSNNTVLLGYFRYYIEIGSNQFDVNPFTSGYNISKGFICLIDITNLRDDDSKDNRKKKRRRKNIITKFLC